KRVEANSLVRRAAGRMVPSQVVTCAGVWGGAAPLVAGTIAESTSRPLLYVCGHLDDADDALDDLETLVGRPITPFPAWETDAAAGRVSEEIAAQRVAVCMALQRGGSPPPLIVAPIVALLQPVPNVKTLERARRRLVVGEETGLQNLLDWLVDAGFEPVEMVEQIGEFAHRGGIIDILPPSATEAVRIEFFGDQIDSIRSFDLDTQRSREQMDRYDLVSVAAGREIAAAQTTHLFSYLPPEAIVCLADAPEVADLARTFYERLGDPTGLYRPEAVFKGMRSFAMLELYPFSAPAADALDFAVQSLQRLGGQPEEALAELAALTREAEVVVYCENAAEAARFGELLADAHSAEAPAVRTALGHLTRGFSWPGERLAVVAHHEIFGRYARKRRLRRVRAGRPIDSFIDLQAGDYVVHVAHGIARFEGLRRLESEGQSDEYLTLRFAKNALLHVPTSQIGLVQKYIGAAGQRPVLSVLGGTSWSRQKQRVAEAIRDMAADMLRIQAMREHAPGEAYPPDTIWQQRFEEEFPYSETEDQLSCLQEIKADQMRGQPMDRLLCGDVGFGKTELAIRAAFKVVEAGRQVAVLVPTTVLAAQHLRTFSERLADYPFTVDVISRFRSAADQKRIAKGVALGKIDILVGTHRLLSNDIDFADLGLVVIDEEQRFGVAHKERFKAMRATVDVLTMTATPIPRTLHMSLLGLRDISNLQTPPLDRRAIHTEVARFDEGLIRGAIQRELAREGQVFFLHNRVGSIQAIADKIQQLVPDARIAIGHGQMPPRQLERVMLGFVHRAYDVLVCTTIIESGLDIPTVNTIIIDNGDRFGLAELHQLRGRVGRYKHRAYCYILLPEDRTLTPVAARRLKAIEEFSDLGAGFQIAMRDLEIRGAGNILGPEQSGHIATVGYELYCQLLDDAVRNLRGEAPPLRRDVSVDLGIRAYIPRRYIPSDRQRMEVYRRIARCADEKELTQLRRDLLDAYGKLPPALETLLDLAEIRVMAAVLGIGSIVLMRPDIIFTIREWAAAKNAFEGAAGTVRMPDDRTVHWRLPPNYLEGDTLLAVVRNQLKRGLPRR
ncbi:MAG: transcription-repair coupling factor, partial [Planctomycetes bacterium]|nr:transcription-repair coupling factor [Planctomycetota bacterium]